MTDACRSSPTPRGAAQRRGGRVFEAPEVHSNPRGVSYSPDPGASDAPRAPLDRDLSTEPTCTASKSNDVRRAGGRRSFERAPISRRKPSYRPGIRSQWSSACLIADSSSRHVSAPSASARSPNTVAGASHSMPRRRTRCNTSRSASGFRGRNGAPLVLPKSCRSRAQCMRSPAVPPTSNIGARIPTAIDSTLRGARCRHSAPKRRTRRRSMSHLKVSLRASTTELLSALARARSLGANERRRSSACHVL